MPQITNSWATPRTSTSKSRPCTGGRAKCQAKPPRHGSPADKLVSQKRMDFEDRINLATATSAQLKPSAAMRCSIPRTVTESQKYQRDERAGAPSPRRFQPLNSRAGLSQPIRDQGTHHAGTDHYRLNHLRLLWFKWI